MSLNPGPFNRKEHMLITIGANVGFSTPYTFVETFPCKSHPNAETSFLSDNIIWSQALPQYYNQAYAKQFSYQILVGLGTNVSHISHNFCFGHTRAFSKPALLAMNTCVSSHADCSVFSQFVGYGMAGLTRRFLVYPSYAVWPTSLVTIARESAVRAPNRRLIRIHSFFILRD